MLEKEGKPAADLKAGTVVRSGPGTDGGREGGSPRSGWKGRELTAF